MKGTLLGQEYLSRQGAALNSLYADLNNASDISDAAPGAAHTAAQRSLYSLPALPEITPMEKDDYINVVADALEIIPLTLRYIVSPATLRVICLSPLCGAAIKNQFLTAKYGIKKTRDYAGIPRHLMAVIIFSSFLQV